MSPMPFTVLTGCMVPFYEITETTTAAKHVRDIYDSEKPQRGASLQELAATPCNTATGEDVLYIGFSLGNVVIIG